METFYFLAVVIIGMAAVAWAVNRSTSSDAGHRAGHRRRAKRDEPPEYLKTPADHRLARSDEIWKARQKAKRGGVEPSSRYTRAYTLGQDKEFWGYSGADSQPPGPPKRRDARESEEDKRSGEKRQARQVSGHGSG